MLSIPASTSVFNLPFLAGKTIQARCHIKEKKKKKKEKKKKKYSCRPGDFLGIWLNPRGNLLAITNAEPKKE
jgi:hypothetical protein